MKFVDYGMPSVYEVSKEMYEGTKVCTECGVEGDWWYPTEEHDGFKCDICTYKEDPTSWEPVS